MDAFGWSTQLPGPPAPSDDALLAAFLGASSFAELHCDGGAGHGTVISSDAYGGALGLPPPCQSDLSLLRCQNGVTLPGRGDASSDVFLDPVGLLPAIDGAHDGFAFANVPAQADGSNTAFSGYSTTTGGGGGGGGNISSGESNTYGGGDTEVASSPCAVSRPMLPQPRAAPTKSNKLPDKYPAAKATAATTAARTSTTSITFGQSGGGGRHGYEPDTEAIAQVKEMIYRAAAMRPVSLGRGPGEASTPAEPSSSKPRRRKNVRISSDPQTVAARLRRERVSERLRALQRLVPGGSKLDTASMLDEAASYLRFLKSQVAALETLGGGNGGARGVDDDGRYASPLQRYAGRNFGLSSRGGGGGAGGATVLAFGRDGGVAGYVKSNRNMQL